MLKNGQIPIKMQYGNINSMKEAGIISQAVDTGAFYVLDLSALENLTLNRGQDFEKIKNATELTQEQMTDYTDLYIINEASHNIFYVEGVTIDNETFYTDYSVQEIDKVSVNLRYVDNVKIPEGYYYVSGTKEIGIVIRNADNTENYKWMLVAEEITEVPADVEIQTTQKEAFIQSVNLYKGYYKNTNNNKVIYLETENVQALKAKMERIRDNQAVFDENTKIKDEYDNEIMIPKGFKIAEDSATDVTGGIVIEDATDSETAGSQFVWIPVGNIKYEGGTKTIELSRYTFSKENEKPIKQDENIIDNYYQEKASSTYGNTTAKEIETFKTKVENNHGYYIGRYEAGDVNATQARTPSSSKTTAMTCREGRYVYNYIEQPQAATLCRNMYASLQGSMTSDLMNSYAWDTAIVFIQEFSGDKNYAFQGKLQNEIVAQTGRATDGTNQDVKCNIYDIAGNCLEWTTETSSNTSTEGPIPCVFRGGYCKGTETEFASYRYSNKIDYSDEYRTFRPILY